MRVTNFNYKLIYITFGLTVWCRNRNYNSNQEGNWTGQLLYFIYWLNIRTLFIANCSLYMVNELDILQCIFPFYLYIYIYPFLLLSLFLTPITPHRSRLSKPSASPGHFENKYDNCLLHPYDIHSLYTLYTMAICWRCVYIFPGLPAWCSTTINPKYIV